MCIITFNIDDNMVLKAISNEDNNNSLSIETHDLENDLVENEIIIKK